MRVWGVVAVLSLAGAAEAQVAVYGMGSGGRISSGGVPGGSAMAFGGTFGIYDGGMRFGPVHLGVDGRVAMQNSHSDASVYGNKVLGVLVGPRLSLSLPPLPFHPYVQVEAGLGATNYGVQRDRSNGLAYQVQGGLDFTVFPQIDVRGEYGVGQIESGSNGSGSVTLQEFGVGLVLRLP